LDPSRTEVAPWAAKALAEQNEPLQVWRLDQTYQGKYSGRAHVTRYRFLRLLDLATGILLKTIDKSNAVTAASIRIRGVEITPVSEEDEHRYYTDIKPDHWDLFPFRTTRLGIIRGYELGVDPSDPTSAHHAFDRNRLLSRAELAMVACRLLLICHFRVREPGSAPHYSDVKGSEWWAGAAHAAGRYGLMSGYPDHTFKASHPVTGDEVVVTLDRILRLQKTEIASSASVSQ